MTMVNSELVVLIFCLVFTYNTVISHSRSLTIPMPLVETKKPDQYMCYAKFLDQIDETYVSSVITDPNPKLAHHVATGACYQPVSEDEIWDCTEMQGSVCSGEAANFGIWDHDTRDSGNFRFPKGLSVRVGRKTPLRYLIVQVHFSEIVQDPKESAVNITLKFTPNVGLNYQTVAFASSGYIPERTENGMFAQNACKWTRPPVTAYRYIIHTHHHGYLVEGFLVRNNTWTLLGSQLSLGKGMDFLDIPGGPTVIQTGDIIASRCLYINPTDKPIKFGMGRGTEMCNFQLDIGFENKYQDHFRRGIACVKNTPEYTFCTDHLLSKSCI